MPQQEPMWVADKFPAIIYFLPRRKVFCAIATGCDAELSFWNPDEQFRSSLKCFITANN